MSSCLYLRCEDYTGGPAHTSGVRYGLTIAAAIARGAP